MYHHPDHALRAYRANEKALHRTTALERAARHARVAGSGPEGTRLTSARAWLARLRLSVN